MRIFQDLTLLLLQVTLSLEYEHAIQSQGLFQLRQYSLNERLRRKCKLQNIDRVKLLLKRILTTSEIDSNFQ